jgi:hypothetical protein
MKTLFRTSALVAVLAVTALTAGRAASPTGSCIVTCRNNTSQPVGPYAGLTSTYGQCCFGLPGFNPCPPGYHLSESEDIYIYPDGHSVHCPA